MFGGFISRSSTRTISGLVFGLTLAGCASQPYLTDDVSPELGGGLRLTVLHTGWRSTVEVCGVRATSKMSGTTLVVPYDCVLGTDTPVDFEHFTAPEVPSLPIEATVTPFVGGALKSTRKLQIRWMNAERLVGDWLAKVAEGEAIELAKKRPRTPGVVWVSRTRSSVKPLGHEKTVADADVVVVAKDLNSRKTDRVCAFEMGTTSTLSAYDVELGVYDARTAKKLGGKTFVNRTPSCPISVYAKMGASTTSSSGPPENEMHNWVRALLADGTTWDDADRDPRD